MSNHVGPVIFADATARQQLQSEGEVITFRTSDRTTGETWWTDARNNTKKGDCVISELTQVHPGAGFQLQRYWSLSGFDSVEAWQDAIKSLNGELTPGRLYYVEETTNGT